MTVTDTPRMHVALRVGDLARSLAFYRDLLGVEPVKVRPRYAKLVLERPPLVLTLNEGAAGNVRAGGLSHLGIQVPSHAALLEARERLGRAGHALRDELATTCCYAVQDKFWVDDPDGNAWEFYEFLGDAAEAGSGSEVCCERTGCC